MWNLKKKWAMSTFRDTEELQPLCSSSSDTRCHFYTHSVSMLILCRNCSEIPAFSSNVKFIQSIFAPAWENRGNSLLLFAKCADWYTEWGQITEAESDVTALQSSLLRMRVGCVADHILLLDVSNASGYISGYRIFSFYVKVPVQRFKNIQFNSNCDLNETEELSDKCT